MFHRVQSEVQNKESKSQEQDEKGYDKEESRGASERTSRVTSREEQPQEERSYRRGSTPDAAPSQEEDRAPARSKESAPVQGKYVREQEEQEIESPAPARAESYKPSTRSYGGYAPASSYTPPEAPSYAGNYSTLTIGSGINMSGEIDACDHLMVEGTVEAALKGAKLLEIAESGTFYGTVEIEEATIAGRFEGDITVSGRLTIKSSGMITGSIAYRDLEVESGALVDGRMSPLKPAVDEKAVDKYRAGSGASAMAKTGGGANKKPANNEAGLFSKAHASY